MRMKQLLPVVVMAVMALPGCGYESDGAAPSDTPPPMFESASEAPIPTTASTAVPASSAPSTPAPAAAVAPAAATTVAVEPLTILVTNDDGIGAPGIDALVLALQDLPDVEVVVVAPASNQSATSDTTTAGSVGTSPSATTSGVAGTAVEGFPADTVIMALDVLGIEPDVVVSGVNTGQNIGTFVSLSGTVGAARTAARRGIPAIAVSAGGLEGSDYATAASMAAAEVTVLRSSLGFGENTDATVVNLNVPTCASGTQVRGVVDVPMATVFPEGSDGINMPFDCASTATDPTDDAIALMVGFAARTIVPADL